MAMLAEPRRKVRYNINPNGNTWANDSSAFGKKMLERMGWSNGKGLGANLDGMTTHVKVSYKCDQQGVGFKDKNDQWTVHEDNFTELLKSLQADGHYTIANGNEADDQSSRKSLELKSKTSRARVHYKKFTRGKDLSRYSSKDLANIFGRATLEKKTKDDATPTKESNTSNDQGDVSSERKEKSFGVDTLQGGSMTDYFKRKMTQFKINFGVKNDDDSYNNEDDLQRPALGFGFTSSTSSGDQENQRPGFGLAFDPSIEDSVKQEVPTSSEHEAYKKDKKSKRKCNDDVHSNRKKLKRQTCDDLHGLPNQAFELFDNVEAFVDNCDSGISLDENPYEVRLKAKKCKKKRADVEDEGVVNPAFDTHDVSQDLNKLMKKSKKKMRAAEGGKQVEGIENPTFNDAPNDPLDEPMGVEEGLFGSGVETIVNPYEVVPKDKIKKRRRKKKEDDNAELGLDNPVFGEYLAEDATHIKKFSGEVIEQNSEETCKKKKTKKHFEHDINVASIMEGITTGGVDVKVKKKKKKKVSTDQGLPEGASSLNDQSSPEGVRSRGERPKSTVDDETKVHVGQAVVSTDVIPTTTLSSIAADLSCGITDDLILNVSSTDPKPILHTPQTHGRAKRRKSVRIDESLNQERIIPNILQQKQMALEVRLQSALENRGVSNAAFDMLAQDRSFYEPGMDVNREASAQRRRPNIGTVGIANPCFRDVQDEAARCRASLETVQAEVENDLNENKLIQSDDAAGNDGVCVEGAGNRYVGTAATLDDHRLAPNGHVVLAFKHAHLPHTVNYCDRLAPSLAKRSYKHLVKGDVEVVFRGANLHAISGYATVESIGKRKLRKARANEDGQAATSGNVRSVPKEHVTDLDAMQRLQERKQRKLQRKLAKMHKKGKTAKDHTAT